MSGAFAMLVSLDFKFVIDFKKNIGESTGRQS